MDQAGGTAAGSRMVTNLGEVIAELRAKRGLSQRALAERSGTSRSSIKNWEASRVTPHVASLAQLGRALGARFADDGHGRYVALDPVDPASPTQSPRVVILVAGTPEAMDAALDRLGVPRVE